MFVNHVKRLIKSLPAARWLIDKTLYRKLPPHGPQGIALLGHRDYVGGLWEQIGQLQYDMLLREGLKPSHVFLDIACGSLRAGVHLIPYLEPGHYLGIDKEEQLIQAGIDKELDSQTYQSKQPQFVISDKFEFDKFNLRADYAIAQSLFTHVPAAIIEMCFQKLRHNIADNGLFFATFFESQDKRANRRESHDLGVFAYTRVEIEAFGSNNGWRAEYIGDWNHPRAQVLVRYRPA